MIKDMKPEAYSEDEALRIERVFSMLDRYLKADLLADLQVDLADGKTAKVKAFLLGTIDALIDGEKIDESTARELVDLLGISDAKKEELRSRHLRSRS